MSLDFWITIFENNNMAQKSCQIPSFQVFVFVSSSYQNKFLRPAEFYSDPFQTSEMRKRCKNRFKGFQSFSKKFSSQMFNRSLNMCFACTEIFIFNPNKENCKNRKKSASQHFFLTAKAVTSSTHFFISITTISILRLKFL